MAGPAPPPRFVLALEFTGVDAAETFDTPLRGLPQTVVRRVDPLAAQFERRRSIPEQAAALYDGLPDGACFVFGYCSAAALATAVAALGHDRGGPLPQAVLFEPDTVTDDYLRQEFEAIYRGLGIDPAGCLDQAAGVGGSDLLARLEADLVGRRATVAARYGGDGAAGELAGYLVARYRAWLRFLAASAAAAPARLGRPVAVITAKPDVQLAGLLAEPDRAAVYRCAAAPGGNVLLAPDTPGIIERILRSAR